MEMVCKNINGDSFITTGQWSLRKPGVSTCVVHRYEYLGITPYFLTANENSSHVSDTVLSASTVLLFQIFFHKPVS